MNESACPRCGHTFTWTNHAARDRAVKRVYCSRTCRDAARGNTPEHFWSRFDKNGPIPAHLPELGPCWVWQGTRDHDGRGYGRVGWHGRLVAAHRLAYQLTYGALGPGERVLHHCDNPPCGRPDHLFKGSQLANIHDMKQKGRGPQITGEHNPIAKLTVEAVRRIRQQYPATSVKQLAQELGVSYFTVWNVAKGRTWLQAD